MKDYQYWLLETFIDPLGQLIQVMTHTDTGIIDIFRCDGVEQLDDDLFDFFEEFSW